MKQLNLEEVHFLKAKSTVTMGNDTEYYYQTAETLAKS